MSFDQINASPHGAFSESHTIETPEQTNIEFTVAGIGSRFLAVLIDTLIQAAIAIIVLLLIGVMAWASSGALGRLGGVWILGFLGVALFFLFYGYFTLFEIFWNGQTPGKRKIGLRVIKDSGRPLSPAETIARNLLRIVDQMPGFYAVGILVALLNKQNKRLGDFVAGSLVVREASLSEIKASWTNVTPASAPFTPVGAERLSDDDVILIESFLRRRGELPPDRRSWMAMEIYRRVEGKLSVGNENRPDIEALLEAAVHERRGV